MRHKEAHLGAEHEISSRPAVRIPVQAGHLFRSIPATDSGPIRPPIPEQAGHPFRSKPAPIPVIPAGHSGRIRPPLVSM